MSTATSPVWLITGASQGLGLEIARAALRRGDRVAATSRHPKRIVEAINAREDHLFALAMDLGDPAQIDEAIELVIAQFGRIDVLVNNAGYGLFGAIEEACDEEIQSIFDINVFGLMRVARAVLPHMRKQRSGRIVNMSSIAGIVGGAGFGIYNATKFALEGLSEALAQEVAPLGIGVTIVEPGPFRTNFLGSSIAVMKNKLAEYDATAGRARRYIAEGNGKQPGDPALAAGAILKAVDAEHPPLHLVLGSIALARAEAKIDSLKGDLESWRAVSLATEFETESVNG